MHRLFVALSLPEVVADAVAQLQSGLPGAKWRDPESFHLTLQFIGDVDRHAAQEAASALAGVAAPAFEMTLALADFFGDRKPRALWAGVSPNPALEHLQSKVDNALRRAGLPAEKRKFVPHVTLAYLSGVSQEAAAAYCVSHGLFSCGPFPVAAFHLYQSYLGRESAHYEIVESYSLSSSR